MMKEKYDLVIVGSGPAGYSAALHAARIGISTLVIEKNVLGGECLNYACIPLKTLLHYSVLKKKIDELIGKGLYHGSLSINLNFLKKAKERVVESLRYNLESMMKRLGIDILYGEVYDLTPPVVKINANESIYEVRGENILLAMGSRPIELPTIRIDEKYIVSSKYLTELKEIPKELGIIGGGVVGVEMATLYSILGSKVTIIELMPSLLPFIDKDISKRLERFFEKSGIKVHVKSRVESVSISNDKVLARIVSGDETSEYEFDKLLLAIGRRPNTDYEFINKLGIETDSKGYIKVDKRQETSVENIYAGGDITGPPMVAHKAYWEGLNTVESIYGSGPLKKPSYFPITIYSYPEIFSIGISEPKEGYQVIKAPITISGKAYAENITGLIKIIADENGKTIKGLHIISEIASSLSPLSSVIVENNLDYNYVIDTIFPHPTYGEALWEALSSIRKLSIHFEA